MRNLFALIGFLVVVVGGVGWYLGWYKLSVTKNPEGTVQIKTDVDTQRATEDIKAKLSQVGAMIGEHVEKTGQDAKAGTQPGSPGNTPGPLTTPTGVTPTVPVVVPDGTPVRLRPPVGDY